MITDKSILLSTTTVGFGEEEFRYIEQWVENAWQSLTEHFHADYFTNPTEEFIVRKALQAAAGVLLITSTVMLIRTLLNKEENTLKGGHVTLEILSMLSAATAVVLLELDEVLSFEMMIGISSAILGLNVLLYALATARTLYIEDELRWKNDLDQIKHDLREELLPDVMRLQNPPLYMHKLVDISVTQCNTPERAAEYIEVLYNPLQNKLVSRDQYYDLNNPEDRQALAAEKRLIVGDFLIKTDLSASLTTDEQKRRHKERLFHMLQVIEQGARGRTATAIVNKIDVENSLLEQLETLAEPEDKARIKMIIDNIGRSAENLRSELKAALDAFLGEGNLDQLEEKFNTFIEKINQIENHYNGGIAQFAEDNATWIPDTLGSAISGSLIAIDGTNNNRTAHIKAKADMLMTRIGEEDGMIAPAFADELFSIITIDLSEGVTKEEYRFKSGDDARERVKANFLQVIHNTNTVNGDFIQNLIEKATMYHYFGCNNFQITSKFTEEEVAEIQTVLLGLLNTEKGYSLSATEAKDLIVAFAAAIGGDEIYQINYTEDSNDREQLYNGYIEDSNDREPLYNGYIEIKILKIFARDETLTREEKEECYREIYKAVPLFQSTLIDLFLQEITGIIHDPQPSDIEETYSYIRKLHNEIISLLPEDRIQFDEEYESLYLWIIRSMEIVVDKKYLDLFLEMMNTYAYLSFAEMKEDFERRMNLAINSYIDRFDEEHKPYVKEFIDKFIKSRDNYLPQSADEMLDLVQRRRALETEVNLMIASSQQDENYNLDAIIGTLKIAATSNEIDPNYTVLHSALETIYLSEGGVGVAKIKDIRNAINADTEIDSDVKRAILDEITNVRADNGIRGTRGTRGRTS